MTLVPSRFHSLLLADAERLVGDALQVEKLRSSPDAVSSHKQLAVRVHDALRKRLRRKTGKLQKTNKHRF